MKCTTKGKCNKLAQTAESKRATARHKRSEAAEARKKGFFVLAAIKIEAAEELEREATKIDEEIRSLAVITVEEQI